uniref:Uncharacterized protein n=1 Tax=viral metagenome TaxID=1070528 RepID=A0A6C0E837_9ZZZZ
MTTFTLVNSVKVPSGAAASSTFITGFLDLFKKITSQIGSVSEIMNVLGYSLDSINDLLPVLSADPTLSHLNVNILGTFLVDLINEQVTPMTRDELADLYIKVVQKENEMLDCDREMKAQFLAFLMSMIRRYPDHPYTKYVTRNGSDILSVRQTYFGFVESEIKTDLDDYFEKDPVAREFWCSIIGRCFATFTMQITYAGSHANIAEMYSSLFSDVILIYNDPTYVQCSQVETFMITTILSLSHCEINNRWSQYQEHLRKCLLDHDDDDELDQKDEESAQTVSETTYEMWLQNPFKFNDICVTLFKKIVDSINESTRTCSEKSDTLNSKFDEIVSLLETDHAQKIAEAVVNMFPTDEVDDDDAYERFQIVIADDLAKNPTRKPLSPETSQNILKKALVILKDIRLKRSITERMKNLQQRIDNFQKRLDANASTLSSQPSLQDQQQYPYVVIEVDPDHDPSSSTPVDVQDAPVVSLEKVPVDVQDTSVASLESLPNADDRLKSNMLDIAEKLDNYLKTHGIPDEFDPDEKYQAPEIPDEFDPDAEQMAKNSVRQFIKKTKEVYGEDYLTKTSAGENVPPPPNSTPDDTDLDESSSVTPVMSDVPQPNPKLYAAKSALDSVMELLSKKFQEK